MDTRLIAASQAATRKRPRNNENNGYRNQTRKRTKITNTDANADTGNNENDMSALSALSAENGSVPSEQFDRDYFNFLQSADGLAVLALADSLHDLKDAFKKHLTALHLNIGTPTRPSTTLRGDDIIKSNNVEGLVFHTFIGTTPETIYHKTDRKQIAGEDVVVPIQIYGNEKLPRYECKATQISRIANGVRDWTLTDCQLFDWIAGKQETTVTFVMDAGVASFYKLFEENIDPAPQEKKRTVFNLLTCESKSDAGHNLQNMKKHSGKNITITDVKYNKEGLYPTYASDEMTTDFRSYFCSIFTLELSGCSTKVPTLSFYKGESLIINPIYETENRIPPTNKDAIIEELSSLHKPEYIQNAIQRKRSGDWLQILRCHNITGYDNILFVTHDQICATYALTMNIDTLFTWHDKTTGKMKLWLFRKPKESAARKLTNRILQFRTFENPTPSAILAYSKSQRGIRERLLGRFEDLLRTLFDAESNIEKKFKKMLKCAMLFTVGLLQLKDIDISLFEGDRATDLYNFIRSASESDLLSKLEDSIVHQQVTEYLSNLEDCILVYKKHNTDFAVLYSNIDADFSSILTEQPTRIVLDVYKRIDKIRDIFQFTNSSDMNGYSIVYHIANQLPETLVSELRSFLEAIDPSGLDERSSKNFTLYRDTCLFYLGKEGAKLPFQNRHLTRIYLDSILQTKTLRHIVAPERAAVAKLLQAGGGGLTHVSHILTDYIPALVALQHILAVYPFSNLSYHIQFFLTLRELRYRLSNEAIDPLERGACIFIYEQIVDALKTYNLRERHSFIFETLPYENSIFLDILQSISTDYFNRSLSAEKSVLSNPTPLYEAMDTEAIVNRMGHLMETIIDMYTVDEHIPPAIHKRPLIQKKNLTRRNRLHTKRIHQTKRNTHKRFSYGPRHPPAAPMNSEWRPSTEMLINSPSHIEWQA